MPKGIRANVALSLTSLLLTLGVAVLAYEVAANVRYYRWRRSFDNEGWIGRLTVRSRNPVLLWEYRPYGEVGTLATNHYGFREFDYPTPLKPAGIQRVAFIGDSVTLGMGVEARETFVAQVGTLSETSGSPRQVLNFGVDGYNALQIRELLTARVLHFKPDEVVYVMCLNDFDFTDSSGRKMAYFRKPWLFFPGDLKRRWRSLIGTEFHRYHFDRNREEVFRAVSEMREILRRSEVAFHLFLLPVFPDEGGNATYFSDYPLAALHKEILEAAKQHDLRTHDLLDVFRRQPPPADQYCLDLWHLSRLGHEVVAASILPVLLEP